ncbi:MAG: LysR family transcriptional regulator [Lachnospiraceae bacterium]|nr:LysR family transcriptional regulator [Lachnospiraceae bacterium]
MNITHMKYALEISRQGSLNKAAEALFIAQPNLSRAIKELEGELGVSLFVRSGKGMEPTPEGAIFLEYAEKILKKMDEVADLFKTDGQSLQRFSLCGPRSSYISAAFARFCASFSSGTSEVYYKETNSRETLKSVLDTDYKLGIIRYSEKFDSYFQGYLFEKKLVADVIARFSFKIVMSKDSPLAEKEVISKDDLAGLMEVAYSDLFVPSLPLAEVKKADLQGRADRCVFIYERASQLEILSENADSFMWSAPLPAKTLDRYGLIQKDYADNDMIYKDVLIYRNDHFLTELDNLFLKELEKSKEECL